MNKEREKEAFLFDGFPSVSKEIWKKKVEESASVPSFYEDITWNIEDGLAIEPLYTEEETEKFSLVRGSGQGNNNWRATEDLVLSNAKNTARAAALAIDGGADALTFHLKTTIKRKTLETLIKDIDPLRTSVNFALNEDPEKVCNLFISACRKKGIDTTQLNGGVFFDPFSVLLTCGTSSTTLEEQIEKIVTAVEYLSEHAPDYGAFSVKSRTFKDSGASITQELAFTVAAAVEYLVMLLERGVKADTACRHLVFSFSTGSSYFAEIAKLRAARVLWTKVVEKFSPTVELSGKMKIHCHTTSFNKTVYDPYLNIPRATVEAMASVIGGTDFLTVEAFDASYKEPDEFSTRMARNIQLLIKNESRLDAVIDPGGGSYHIEKLTRSIAQKSLELFQKIETEGGYFECLKNGFIQNAIKSAREKILRDVSLGKQTILGTNEFPNIGEKMANHIQKVSRDQAKAKTALPAAEPLEELRAAQRFEKVRIANEEYARKNGELKFFLLHLSASAVTKTRAAFSMNFFGCGGFSIVDGDVSPGADSGIAAVLGEAPEVVVICGSDEDYEQSAARVIKQLKNKKPNIKTVVAGAKQSLREELIRAGTDDFIHKGSEVLEMIEKYHEFHVSEEVRR